MDSSWKHVSITELFWGCQIIALRPFSSIMRLSWTACWNTSGQQTAPDASIDMPCIHHFIFHLHVSPCFTPRDILCFVESFSPVDLVMCWGLEIAGATQAARDRLRDSGHHLGGQLEGFKKMVDPYGSASFRKTQRLWVYVCIYIYIDMYICLFIYICLWWDNHDNCQLLIFSSWSFEGSKLSQNA